jgi:hypothetical protein
MNQLLVEKSQIVQAFKPVALNSGAPTIDWVSLKEYGRCSVVLTKAVGTAGDDPTITLLQATDVTGTGSKALTINRVDKKQAATDLTAVGQFTTSTPASPATHDTFNANTWTNSDLAEDAAVIVIEVKAEDLDINNGFDCVSITIADVGTNAQLAAGLFVLHEPRDQTVPLPSAIVD